MFEFILKKNLLLHYAPGLLIIPVIILLIGLKLKNVKITMVALSMIAFLFYFFRVPAITTPPGFNSIVSPSSGTIVNIDETPEHIHISTFLTAFDDHIQYIPYDAFLTKMEHIKGTFAPAMILKKSNFNERTIYNMNTKIGKISVIQLAGLLARRIHPLVEEKTIVKKGDRLGLIKFGSRVDIIVPKVPGLRLIKRVGDKLIGGESILFDLSEYKGDLNN